MRGRTGQLTLLRSVASAGPAAASCRGQGQQLRFPPSLIPFPFSMPFFSSPSRSLFATSSSTRLWLQASSSSSPAAASRLYSQTAEDDAGRARARRAPRPERITRGESLLDKRGPKVDWLAVRLLKLPDRDKTFPILLAMLPQDPTQSRAKVAREFAAVIAHCFDAKLPHVATQLFDHYRTNVAGQGALVYNTMIQGYSHMGDHGRVLSMQFLMQKAGVKPTPSTYVALSTAWAKAGDVERVQQLLKEVLELDLPRRTVDMMYTTTISALGKSGDIEAMEMTFADMQAKGRVPRGAIYNAMLHCYGLHQQIDKIEAMIEQMRSSPHVDMDDDFTQSTVMSAWARAGLIDKALEAFKSLKKPSLYTWNVVIDTLGRAGRCDEMLSTLDAMKRAGFKPTTTAYNTVINAFAIAKNTDSMLDTFKAMRRNGVAADVRTYNTLIDMWAKTGKVVEVEKFYVLMKREGLQPTLYTITSLMDAYSRAGQFEKVLRLISRMKQEGRAPDAVVFNVLIDAYGRMGKPEEAEKVLCGAMKEYGIDPEINNFTSIIESWARNGDLDKAEEWLHRMSRDYGKNPDIKSFTTLLSFCIPKEDRARGNRVIWMINKNRLRLDKHARLAISKFYTTLYPKRRPDSDASSANKRDDTPSPSSSSPPSSPPPPLPP